MTIESDPKNKSKIEYFYNTSDLFNKYKIAHYFFLEKSKDEISPEKLYELLKENVEYFQPDYLLIHAGQYFFMNINSFYHALKKINTCFPQIKIRTQKRNLVLEAQMTFSEILNTSYKTIKLE